MKERLLEFLSYLGIGQTKFEEKTGLSRGLINNIKGDIAFKTLKKIIENYPELNENWLMTGEGDMLKGIHVQQFSNVNSNDNLQIGQVNGSNVTVTNNGNKDKVIEQQDKSLEALTEQLVRFHEVVKNKDDQIERKDAHILRKDEQIERKDEQLERKDNYIIGQKEEIKNITKYSYLRNERNMERIDKFVEQQNKLIEMVVSQNAKMQERADRLLTLLENKDKTIELLNSNK